MGTLRFSCPSYPPFSGCSHHFASPLHTPPPLTIHPPLRLRQLPWTHLAPKQRSRRPSPRLRRHYPLPHKRPDHSPRRRHAQRGLRTDREPAQHRLEPGRVERRRGSAGRDERVDSRRRLFIPLLHFTFLRIADHSPPTGYRHWRFGSNSGFSQRSLRPPTDVASSPLSVSFAFSNQYSLLTLALAQMDTPRTPLCAPIPLRLLPPQFPIPSRLSDSFFLQLGRQSVVSVVGPLARSFSSITYFVETVLNAQPAEYDATALPLPFDSSATSRIAQREKLSFGVIRTDHTVTPHPPQVRALEESVEKLREAGHEGAFPRCPFPHHSHSELPELTVLPFYSD